MLQFNFSPFPVLDTPRLRLREIRLADTPEFYKLRSSSEVMKYIGRPLAQNHEEVTALIQLMIDNTAANASITWAITLKDDDTLIGNISLWRIDCDNHRAETGYILHPAHSGRGIVSEALQAVLAYGFGTMMLHSIQGNTDPENTASIRVLQKAGFVREAYFKEDYYVRGTFLDTAVYSLLTSIKGTGSN